MKNRNISVFMIGAQTSNKESMNKKDERGEAVCKRQETKTNHMK